jgi:hypothetical protein
MTGEAKLLFDYTSVYGDASIVIQHIRFSPGKYLLPYLRKVDIIAETLIICLVR